MMNLYNFHTNPEKLDGYERRFKIPSFAYEYGKSNGFTDEVISLIAKDTRSAYKYAKDILNKPWHEAPDIDPKIAHQAELTIAADASLAFGYARYVLSRRNKKTPWHEAEGIDPKIARQAELNIATDAAWAHTYAREVLWAPWHKPGVDPDIARQAEENIAKDAQWAFAYAEAILKKPWHKSSADPDIARKAEETIATDGWANRYEEEFGIRL